MPRHRPRPDAHLTPSGLSLVWSRQIARASSLSDAGILRGDASGMGDTRAMG